MLKVDKNRINKNVTITDIDGSCCKKYNKPDKDKVKL